jgi:diguanylate cyclase (GGDEF)-like protein
VALGLPLAALLASAVAVAFTGTKGFVDARLSLVGLALVAALAERISIQLGPRSWYTPTTPVVVLAGLLGGPLGGAAVAGASQLGVTGSVWRRRSAGAGLAALQGIAAGSLGRAAPGSAQQALALAAAGMAAALVVNNLGRWLILVDRGATPRGAVWRRGALVDLVEAAIAVPLLSVLLLVHPMSTLLPLVTLAALLGALAIAQHLRDTTIAALETEQANARRDILTGAPNRRAFEELLAQHHARIVRGEAPAGLFVIDVDRFKAINDRYGHHTGDLVLVEVVRRLEDGLRASDVVARWGGDELTVVAPGIRGERALDQFAERIRQLIGELPLSIEGTLIPVTVSVGGTLLDGSQSPPEAVARADAAMYEAKRTRDASVVAMPHPRELRLHTASR